MVSAMYVQFLFYLKLAYFLLLVHFVPSNTLHDAQNLC